LDKNLTSELQKSEKSAAELAELQYREEKSEKITEGLVLDLTKKSSRLIDIESENESLRDSLGQREKDFLDTKRLWQASLSDLGKKTQQLAELEDQFSTFETNAAAKDRDLQSEKIRLNTEIDSLSEALKGKNSEFLSKEQALKQRDSEIDRLKGLQNDANRELQLSKELITSKDLD
jgi:hypothetical protein